MSTVPERVVGDTGPIFECIGGPLDGEYRAAPLSSAPFKNGVYCLDDGPRGAHWTWVPLSE